MELLSENTNNQFQILIKLYIIKVFQRPLYPMFSSYKWANQGLEKIFLIQIKKSKEGAE